MPGNSLTERGALYSTPVGLMYVFNLIVGTGALTMPKAFAGAGWLLSLVSVIMLAFMSYLTVTFVIEAMSIGNAYLRIKKARLRAQSVGHDNNGAVIREDSDIHTDEDQPDQTRILQRSNAESVNIVDENTHLLSAESRNNSRDSSPYRQREPGLFAITERVEMGQMAAMFFNKVGRTMFYIALTVYLYGDLAIYAAAIPKSIRDAACTYNPNSTDSNSSVDMLGGDDPELRDQPCWPGVPQINRLDAYRIFLTGFALIMGPFTFFNVQKTKYLQIFTSLTRWLAFGLMVVLAVLYLSKGEGQGHPSIANIRGVPNLFGVCVYSFMCHHSLPSLVTPMKEKGKIYGLFAADYLSILGFYCLLSFTAIFTFPNKCLLDLYTQDFQQNLHCAVSMAPITTVAFIQYYLLLFPVFTLSTNFPIIAITLRNNLKALFHRESRPFPWAVDRLVFPLITIVPPIVVSLITDNIEFLVSITGTFAGSGIQYFIPSSLVLLSRRYLRQNNIAAIEDNPHVSPFKHAAWPIFVFAWAIICIIFVTINHIRSLFGS